MALEVDYIHTDRPRLLEGVLHRQFLKLRSTDTLSHIPTLISWTYLLYLFHQLKMGRRSERELSHWVCSVVAGGRVAAADKTVVTSVMASGVEMQRPLARRRGDNVC